MNKFQSMMKRIIDGYYNKEQVFFEEGTGWYSRLDGKYVDANVIERYVEDILNYYEVRESE
ncbi:hypothetical protein NIGALANA_127 [Bacillus phage Nigalana]|uniref:Uncharacterized protein n=2 Tax=Wphvirus TaxID=1922327 RepID=A0A024B2C3_9CAUD|nr:hypothetical protein FP72_gp120 [Bacillus phage Hakuna]YP_009279293.1 hypothetical protein BIZ89_gp126 [Bacillus phage Kida]YP_009282519.1 hypothetical protein BI005_gp127 [Bacillus phage Nigalana]YP_009285070.1 hypothetical protein BIZ88_gp128 [Bacillus phage DirtyBetty]YP_009287003.1 hypothetical protein BI006_gp127 [Bacillus phage Nemo]ASR78771.1 hypothetical protein BUBS_128 [Bacillus phage Bubs]ASR79223.1 hypothetical protein ZAINNY_128 [Bacillus phage Zainny]QDH49399.1 hypothetical 